VYGHSRWFQRMEKIIRNKFDHGEGDGMKAFFTDNLKNLENREVFKGKL
jgi:hypothetical protein